MSQLTDGGDPRLRVLVTFQQPPGKRVIVHLYSTSGARPWFVEAPSAQVVTVPTGPGSGQLCVQMFRLETTDEDRSAYQRASAPAPVVATASAPVRSSRKANTFARRLLSFIFTNEGAHGIVIGVNKPVCAPIAEELRVNQGSAIAQLRRLGLIEEFELEPPHARVLTLKNINRVLTRVSAAGVDLLLQKSG